MESRISLEELSGDYIQKLFGQLDSNIKKIENAFSVKLINRNGSLYISGDGKDIETAELVLSKLVSLIKNGEEIDEQQLNYIISSVGGNDFDQIEQMKDGFICFTTAGKPIKPKTIGQKNYVDNMKNNTVVFGVGPAGTGKTYLAMAMAITAFKREDVARIILTRPAIEAGEKLGFLPGDLQQKVDPYLRPLYDALHEIMGGETFQKNMEKGVIEVAPLAYMRGRTLDNAYIILDEAQNTTPEQMKMFLTRIGFGSKAIITGDITQIDLLDEKESGLVQAIDILKDIEGIGISRLTNRDVVRHPLVQKIIGAYDKFEKKKKYKEERAKQTDKRNIRYKR